MRFYQIIQSILFTLRKDLHLKVQGNFWKTTPYPGGFKIMTFEERMQQMYNFYVGYDIDIDHENKELHINAFSANDMY